MSEVTRKTQKDEFLESDEFNGIKKRSIWLKAANYIIERQIELPLKFISAVMLSYLVSPTPENPFSKFLFVSYPIPQNDHDGNPIVLYGKGYWDLTYIFFWIVIFTLTREFTMKRILRPLGVWANINSRRKVTRFTEQSYVVIYCSITSTVGLIIMRNSPYWFFDTKYFWIDYPHIELTYLTKSYYLIQFAFWLQQILVLILQLEKPRKDFVELVAHHIITCLLIGGSYISNFTRVGNAVFITMDFSDIWLALAKCMKYMAFPATVTDFMFVFFMTTWAYTRHYLYGLITYSTWADSCLPEFNECIWDPLNGYWLTPYSKYFILFGLVLLQILMIYWFSLILRIAWRVVVGGNAEDTRSDTEDDDENGISTGNPPNTKKTD